MSREYFCAYHSFLKSVEPLNDAERGRLFTACLQYSETGVEPELRGNERFVFPTIREQIDRDKNKYKKICEINKANGSIGGQATATERQRPLPNGGRNLQDKDKGEDKGDIVICADAPEIPQNIFITFLLNDKTEYEVAECRVKEYAELYPAVNVEQELRKIKAWCIANPKKRKTRGGAEKFINSWLSREQDKGINNQDYADKSKERRNY